MGNDQYLEKARAGAARADPEHKKPGTALRELFGPPKSNISPVMRI
jgi:hypothetical protein